MTAASGSGNRDVVPRWRGLANTLVAGEFAPIQGPRTLPKTADDALNRLDALWRTDESEVSAAELAAGALVTGEVDRAAHVVRQLKDSGIPDLRLIATVLEDQRNPEPRSPSLFRGVEKRFERTSDRIRDLKRRVILDPRDAISWIDLGRWYVLSGQSDQALSAVKVAVALAPDNRYILRCASCFYTQSERPDIALDLLRRAPNLTQDPWLVAAELAISAVADEPATTFKLARRIVRDEAHPPIHLTEVASELGTLEHRSGNERKARQLLGSALAAPTDNSLAQIEWASHRVPGVTVSDQSLLPPLAAEARTLDAEERGDWTTALRHAAAWLADQPFSRAASSASYIAATGLRDWAGCQRFAELGLHTRPNDPTLLNNLSYALIEQNKLEDARKQLLLLAHTSPEDKEQAAIQATYGLFQYRVGKPLEGRRLYQQAISIARRHHNNEEIAMASLLLAREEILSGSEEARIAIAEAKQAAKRASSVVVDPWVELLDHLYSSHT